MTRFPYDCPGVYAIHIAGKVDKGWADCLGGLAIRHEEDLSGESVTVLTGSLPDQAALYGVLNALYNARYPLLFVRYLRPG